MKKLPFPLLLLCLPLVLSCQVAFNTTLLYQYDDPANPVRGGDVVYNDVWGYATPSGKEYAILGGVNNIWVFDVTDTDNVVLIGTDVVANQTYWRDFKTYRHYLYAVSEGGSGLRVYDLDSLAVGKLHLVSASTADFTSAHNIFIDEAQARLYVAGANGSSGASTGLIVYNLATDSQARNPSSPVKVNFAALPASNTAACEVPSNGFYVHDLYVTNNIAYCSHGYSGFYIWDFTNPASPTCLGSQRTGGYNHSSWRSEDGQYIYYAEELGQGRPIGILDISNLSDINPVSSFKMPLLEPTYANNTPHNPFVRGNFLYVSYYEDGLQVFDVADPMNVTRVAYYDTEPANTTYSGTTANWGCYPFLPSGNVLVSDTHNGLFVVQLNLSVFPVELVGFSARAAGKTVQLSWATLSETNNAFFTVERSTNGRDFLPLLQVPGSGNSQQQQDYRALDPKPLPGKNYYRLKQTDFDGQHAYSAIEVVDFVGEAVRVFPTLVTGTAPVQLYLPTAYGSGGRVEVVNVQGQVVFAQALAGEWQVDLQLPPLPNGMYFLKFQYEQTRQVERLLLLR
ncbi:MAG: hypothetical protein DA408_04705 [Bacteroidetes bacterium]|nr:MAG: hypothetical protein C7N36_07135 [Bacteroidota bacterium]PTM14042.1 MAG: hypothetical protein DA408_04705 [Bacteroidota bacterium]